MLREAKIIVPNYTNDGRPLGALQAEVGRRLHKAFGGMHTFPVSGIWTDPKDGQEYAEGSFAFITAATPDIPYVDEQLRQIALYAAQEGQQEAIYLQLPSGRV